MSIDHTDELHSAYDRVLEDFALALPHRRSPKLRVVQRKTRDRWHRANIHLTQAAFYALKLEVQRRNATAI
jgi:hypothetical protein